MANSVRLNNGVLMPLLGIGTYQLVERVCEEAVRYALQIGYRMIDTATGYKNEGFVGKAMLDSGTPRAEVFVTSKLAPADQVNLGGEGFRVQARFVHISRKQGEESAYAAVLRSLEKMQMSHIDLYLIHWPGTRKLQPEDPENAVRRAGSWRGLSRAYREGKLAAIGVSNYTTRHLQELLAMCDMENLPIPAVNQVEFHPFYQQSPLLELCRTRGIVLEAYSSLGQAHSDLLEHAVVTELAAKYGRTRAQILLRWAVQQQVPVIPRSSRPERIMENAQIFDFQLDPEDMYQLAQLDRDFHFCWHADKVT